MSGETADAFAKLEAHKLERAKLATIRTNEAKKVAANSNDPSPTPQAAKNAGVGR